ncbi:MAG: hypothetical protein HY909_11940 [Deltaproteobacteria bacterium]|nr:hypothetical protein [Deltaproteobacteria bacterium]
MRAAPWLVALLGAACTRAELPPGEPSDSSADDRPPEDTQSAALDTSVVEAPSTDRPAAPDAASDGALDAPRMLDARPADASPELGLTDSTRADSALPDRPEASLPDAPRSDGADAAALDSPAPDTTATVDSMAVTDATAFSDAGTVAPRRMRVGPQGAARVLFTSSEQKGAFWELPGGDVLTSFQTSRTPIRPGVAVYDLGYRMRRIVSTTVRPMPDTASGTCRDDGTLRGCDVGPDPSGSGEYSLVADDGAVLLLQRRAGTDGRSALSLGRLDPATGVVSTVAEYPELRSARSDSAYDPPRALRLLGSGQVALTAQMVDTPARTLVLATDGSVQGRSEGFAYGERWSPFALLLGDSAYAPGNRLRWWDARTGAQTALFTLPGAMPGTSPPSFRTFPSPNGNVLFPGYTYTDRLLHVGTDGRLVEDRAFTPSGFLGVYPDGAYLTYERYGVGDLGYAARARTAAGEGTLLYDDATLVRDAGWSPMPRGGFRYPYLLGAKRAVIDEAGNAYVAFVLQTGGDTATETYLAGFARDGRRLWGLRLPTYYGGECTPRAVLTGRRVAVVCPGRFTNRFLLVGE